MMAITQVYHHHRIVRERSARQHGAITEGSTIINVHENVRHFGDGPITSLYETVSHSGDGTITEVPMFTYVSVMAETCR
jgi:hypothetical protein